MSLAIRPHVRCGDDNGPYARPESKKEGWIRGG
jgi:hypothetical protein